MPTAPKRPGRSFSNEHQLIELAKTMHLDRARDLESAFGRSFCFGLPSSSGRSAGNYQIMPFSRPAAIA
jgi:hypothetical protein